MGFPRSWYRFLLVPTFCLTFVPTLARAATELLDFGAGGTGLTISGSDGRFWNNIPDSVATTTLSSVSLVDTTNAPTGISLLVTNRFNGSNTAGTAGSTLYPSTATSDSLFGNTGTAFNGIAAPTPTFVLSGLTVGVPYDFTFYASRIGAGGDTRTTDYLVTGAISGSTKLNASENINGTASVFSITPTASGQITVSLQASTDNNNANQFIYLGVLELKSVPEPTSAALLSGGLLMWVGKRRRRESAQADL